MKRALITGITGQDGSYLAELLLEKGYEVSSPCLNKFRRAVHTQNQKHPSQHCPNTPRIITTALIHTRRTHTHTTQVHGIVRRSSSFNTGKRLFGVTGIAHNF